MSTRERASQRAEKHFRALLHELLQEYRAARVDRALSQDAVGAVVGVSGVWVGRIERGLEEDVSLRQLVLMFSAVGMKLTARPFPDYAPVRDEASLRLLGRFRAQLPDGLGWSQEVGMPRPGDQRAWDAVIRGSGWRLGIEAETRPRDVQAVIRRIELKVRDSGVDGAVLLLLRSRFNRELLDAHGPLLGATFPVDGAAAMRLLRAGERPGGNAIVLA